ncbi:PilN domain-containing protein [Pseudomonas sp. X10]
MLRLNLLPWRERRRQAAVRRFQASVIGVMVLALCGVMVLDHLSRQRLQQQALANMARQEDLSRLDSRIEQLAAMGDALAALRTQQAALVQLREGQGQASELFAQIEAASPPGLYLTAMDLQGDQLRLTGLATSGSLVAQFVRHLQSSLLLRDVDLQQIKSGPQGDGFTLSAQMRAPWS